MVGGEWSLNQQNLIKFVLIDSSGAEVSGLGGTFDLGISKGGFPVPAFTPGLGLKGEISRGWYYYQSVLAESDTSGEIAIYAEGVGTIQQNLVYTCSRKSANASPYSYPVISSVTGLPIPGVKVWFTTDAAGANIVFVGTTDTFGIVRDNDGDLPVLEHGTYYIWKLHPGFTDDDYPDIETVP